MKDAMKRVSDADGGGIVLIRDQAKVTVKATADSGFTLSDAGYYVCNTNAFGTIAPYNRVNNAFDWRTSDPKYITLISASKLDSRFTNEYLENFSFLYNSFVA